MKKRNNKGFTLTEMIVVIAIIGILAAVLIPSVVVYVQRAKQSNDEQLAASMTDEIERYCIENNIDQEDLCGTDIRTILISKQFNLVPSNKKWSYFYNESKKVVEVIKFKDLSAGTSEYDDITEVVKGYYLIGKGDNEIELLVSALVAGEYSFYQSNQDHVEGYDGYANMLDSYSFDKTIYIGPTSILNPQLTLGSDDEPQYQRILFCELVGYIPNLTIYEKYLVEGYVVENANFSFIVNGDGNLASLVNARGVKKLDLTTFSSNVSAKLPTDSTISNFEQKINLNSSSSTSEVISAGGYLTQDELETIIFTVGSDINESSYEFLSFTCVDDLRKIWKMSVTFVGTTGIIGYREVYYTHN